MTDDIDWPKLARYLAGEASARRRRSSRSGSPPIRVIG
jgi:hypothetical protein